MRHATGPIRVLHVDDDEQFAELSAVFLEREDDRLAVETASSVDEGLDLLAEDDFDCVVSDHDMPGRDGIDLLWAVRDESLQLPFILFTGKGSEEIASEAISAGVTDYLQKRGGTSQYAVLANRITNAVGQALARRERQRHLDAIETAKEGISILDEQERFVYVNRAYADMYGYEPEKMVGEHWSLVYDDDGLRTVEEEIRPVVEAEGYWHGETTGKRADGSVFVEEHTIATTSEGGFVCIVRDITGRKERERRFEAVFDNTYTFIGLLEPDGTVLEANETALSFAGIDREEVVGEPVWETYWFQVGEESRTVARDAVERARSGESYRDEIRVQGADREAVIDFTLRPVTDEDGEVTSLVPEGHDITEIKRRTQQLRTLVDTLPGVVYRCENEPGWPIERIRGEVEELTGYTRHAFETGAVTFEDDLVHPEDREEVRATVADAMARQESFETTYRIVTEGGETKWVWERGRYVSSVGTDEEALTGFVTDVTKRREIAAELHREREFVDLTLDRLDDIFYVVGRDGELYRWNDQLATVTGYDDEEIETMRALEFFPDEERERIAGAIDEALTAGSATVESELLTANGDRVPYEFTGTRLDLPDDEGVGLVGIGRNIEERRRDDHDRRREIERLDEFVSVVTHDLQSPLGVAGGRIELARTECDSEHLDVAADALARSRELIDDLVAVAREGHRADSVEAVTLTDVVTNCWRNVRTGNATLVLEGNRTLHADRSRLQQLLENLVRNAVEHGGEDVTVTVGELDDGFYVADDGPGIPESEREQVFEPGYTTTSDGTGFGLSIVRSIAEDHGCRVTITDSDDGGTRVEVTGADVVE
ncbi:PAS domain S-box protein [Salinigranum sp.]|uniref:hybrid sensor histidine kinase/response regulator n=1 Tax=Salinigranum sp. TaxID=1966351 RepID=UPI0035624644